MKISAKLNPVSATSLPLYNIIPNLVSGEKRFCRGENFLGEGHQICPFELGEIYWTWGIKPLSQPRPFCLLSFQQPFLMQTINAPRGPPPSHSFLLLFVFPLRDEQQTDIYIYFSLQLEMEFRPSPGGGGGRGVRREWVNRQVLLVKKKTMPPPCEFFLSFPAPSSIFIRSLLFLRLHL